MTIVPIDLRHQDHGGAICTWLIDGREPALVDPGPSTTLPRLREALAELGMGTGDLRHILLTHVHLDHAGGAGHLVAENPKLTVHVHPDGAPHMADPTRLVASTRRTFGERYDALWGETKAVPREVLRPWEIGTRLPMPLRPLRPVATPGHIGHHLAYLHEGEGTLLVGDALGIVLAPGAAPHPATPSPAVDLAAWRVTLAEMRTIGPERAGLAHFGLHDDVEGRTHLLEEALGALEAAVRRALERDRVEEEGRLFDDRARAALAERLPRERVDRFFDVFSPLSDWAGVERYLRIQAKTMAGAGER